MLPELPVPLVAAPMAGGPSTPDLVVAVGEAGGLGFLGGGYKTVDAVRAEIDEVRRRSTRPFGVNVFLAGSPTSDPGAVALYRDSLAADAAALGVEPGEPRWEDDEFAAKLAVVAGVPLVSLTFGCPPRDVVNVLQEADSLVVLTVTSPDEARVAAEVGPDALWVQGEEAGAHRGTFADVPTDDGGAPGVPLLDLLDIVHATTDLPLIAAGGLMDGADVRAAMEHGATWAAMGTAFLGCPEAATTATHLAALQDPRFGATAMTRAFTGRPARALVNDFVRAHDADAPSAYPEVHHVTRPLRTAAAEAGDAHRLHLWAGTGWQRLRPMPAADLVRTIAAQL